MYRKDLEVMCLSLVSLCEPRLEPISRFVLPSPPPCFLSFLFTDVETHFSQFAFTVSRETRAKGEEEKRWKWASAVFLWQAQGDD